MTPAAHRRACYMRLHNDDNNNATCALAMRAVAYICVVQGDH